MPDADNTDTAIAPGSPVPGGGAVANAGDDGRSPAGQEPAAVEELAAEEELAALVLPGAQSRPDWQTSVQLAVFTAARLAAGIGVRALIVPGAPETAAAWALVAALLAVQGWRYQRAPRRGEPPWVAAARIHQRALQRRLPPQELARAGRYLQRLSPPGYLYVHRCPGPAHDRLCGNAAIMARGGRYLVAVGEHVAARPQEAAFTLAHEVNHTTAWYRWAALAVVAARGLGFAALGWTLPWPQALAAAVVAQAVTVAVMWCEEIGCDLAAAAREGPQAGLDAFGHFAGVHAGEKARRGRWRWYASCITSQAIGLQPHPPLRLRAALIRACRAWISR